MTDEENWDEFIESFEGEVIDVSDTDIQETSDDDSVGDYFVGEPLDVEVTSNTPEWLVHQVEKMRKKADQINDFIDIYDRFQDEQWDEMPSEVEGFLRHHGYSDSGDPLKWLTDKGAELSVELYEQKGFVSELYNGEDILDTTEVKRGMEDENIEKVDTELRYASSTMHSVKHAGATTEGGWTDPYPTVNTERQYSLGHQFRKERDDLED